MKVSSHELIIETNRKEKKENERTYLKCCKNITSLVSRSVIRTFQICFLFRAVFLITCWQQLGQVLGNSTLQTPPPHGRPFSVPEGWVPRLGLRKYHVWPCTMKMHLPFTQDLKENRKLHIFQAGGKKMVFQKRLFQPEREDKKLAKNHLGLLWCSSG